MENISLLIPDYSSLKELFGVTYLSQNNCEELKNNYQELLNIKDACLKEISEFIKENNSSRMFSLESWKLELLLLKNPSPSSNENFKTYYNLQELTFIRLLKQIATGTYEITEEDYKLLYYYIPNRLSIEQLITNSTYDILNLDLNTLKVINRITTQRNIPIGHNIRNYERLSYKLGLSKYPIGPNLELKAS